ncbi:MAG: hypothetical protein IPN51_12950 [Chloracidobacterium sp.]|nr:hypothetical protein [Chloracidobacterium sp.]
MPTSSTTIVGGVNVSKTLIEYDHSGSDTTITKEPISIPIPMTLFTTRIMQRGMRLSARTGLGIHRALCPTVVSSYITPAIRRRVRIGEM